MTALLALLELNSRQVKTAEDYLRCESGLLKAVDLCATSVSIPISTTWIGSYLPICTQTRSISIYIYIHIHTCIYIYIYMCISEYLSTRIHQM